MFVLDLVVTYIVIEIIDFNRVTKRSVTIRGRNRKSPPRALQFPAEKGSRFGVEL